MDFQELTKQEKEWLNLLLSRDFRYKEILLQQALTVKAKREDGGSYVSVLLSPDKKKQKYPLNIRVPVEVRARQKSMAPTIFLLHLIDGYINEMEIFSADSSIINIEGISLDDLEFILDPSIEK